MTEVDCSKCHEVRKHSGINDRPLDRDAIEQRVVDDRAGALVVFSGVVRNHDTGQHVTGLEYSAHPSAGETLAQIVEEIAHTYPLYSIAIEHRVGRVDVGGLAMVAAVSAAHRSEAFAANAALVDLVKEKLPIWKEQFYVDQTSGWVGLEQS